MTERTGRRPAVIDTDPGIDDALAIVLALRSAELRVELVTTVAGNIGLRAATDNARRILALLDPEKPPRLVPGAARPLRGRPTTAPRVHGDDGLVGLSRVRDRGGRLLFPASRGPLPARESAADAIVDKARRARREAHHGRSRSAHQHRAGVRRGPVGHARHRAAVRHGWRRRSAGQRDRGRGVQLSRRPRGGGSRPHLRDADHPRRARRDSTGAPALARGARRVAGKRVPARPRDPSHDTPARVERRRIAPPRSPGRGARDRRDAGSHAGAAGPGRDEGRAYPGNVGCRPAPDPGRAARRREGGRGRCAARGRRVRSRRRPRAGTGCRAGPRRRPSGRAPGGRRGGGKRQHRSDSHCPSAAATRRDGHRRSAAHGVRRKGGEPGRRRAPRRRRGRVRRPNGHRCPRRAISRAPGRGRDRRRRHQPRPAGCVRRGPESRWTRTVTTRSRSHRGPIRACAPRI